MKKVLLALFALTAIVATLTSTKEKPKSPAPDQLPLDEHEESAYHC